MKYGTYCFAKPKKAFIFCIKEAQYFAKVKLYSNIAISKN